MVLYGEKEPDYNNVYDDTVLSTVKWQQSFIAYLKEPEFKCGDFIYHIETREKWFIRTPEFPNNFICDNANSKHVIFKSILKSDLGDFSHYYPGQEWDGEIKYVRLVKNYNSEADQPHRKSPIYQTEWQEVEEPDYDTVINLIDTTDNCPNGVMINKDGTIHSRFKRNFSSEKIKSEGRTFHRTGQIFEINNEPIIVYKVN